MPLYGPAVPPTLPDNADQQRRMIGDYIRQTPKSAASGQGFVNQTNTDILTAIQKNNNLANDNNPQTQNQGALAPGPQGPANTSPAARTSGTLNTDSAILPQPNVLDRFASYTYSASVYLMSTKQYTQLLRSKKKSINGYNLLFQSGGAPPNTGGFMGQLGPGQQTTTGGDKSVSTAPPGGVVGTNDIDRGRNPAFPLDFYIDSITIDNALPGKQTQAAHMVTNLKFTVVEPGNISLLDRLYQAVQDMGQVGEQDQPINYTAAAYLMVIRWYGYDQNGVLIPVGAADPNTGLTDPNAVVEKFIPFLIKKVNWQVSSKLVTYEFDCAPINQMVASGTRRGTIPYDVQLTENNVGKLLGGELVYASASPPVAPTTDPGSTTTVDQSGRKTAASDPRTFANQAAANASRVPTATNAASLRAAQDAAAGNTPAPAKANAATSAKLAVKDGLMGAMNAYQRQLVQDGIYSVADTYEIVFVADSQGHQPIRDAQITLPGTRVKDQSQTGMKPGPTQIGSQGFNEAANAMDISNRNWSITAGMQTVQAIDLAIRNSTYITSQALTVYDETTGVEIPNPALVDKAQISIKWFQISMEAQQGAYDNSRNDYAYHIKFIVSPYELTNFDSKYFPLSKFRGVHKSYPFWFTGENTAVIDFTANFNSLYNITVTGEHANESQAAKLREKFTASMRDIPKYTYMPASNATRQGASNKGNEIGANASEYLYSPGDMARSRVRIIGDPAWIQQGNLAGGVNPQEFSYSAFLPDGTINFDASQVMFEIAWQRPEDYNLSTGLADPYSRPGNQARQPVQSTVYQATKVTSEFKAGKFEQTLEGSLYFFPIPSKKNTVAAAPDQSTAETQRLQRQNEQAAAATRRSADNADNVAGTSGPAGGFTADQLRAKSAVARLTGTLPVPGRTSAVTDSSPAGSSSIPFPDLANLLPAKPVTSNGETVGAASSGLLFNVFSGAPKKINQPPITTGVQPGAHDY